jgi:hypothetical protein
MGICWPRKDCDSGPHELCKGEDKAVKAWLLQPDHVPHRHAGERLAALGYEERVAVGRQPALLTTCARRF